MPQKIPTTVTVSPSTFTVLVGNTQALSVTVLDQFGMPYVGPLPVTYSSDDPTMATVSGTGVVTGVSVGDTRVVVACGAASDYSYPKVRL